MFRDPAAAIGNPARLAAVRRLGLLDTPADPAFDRLTRLAARLLDAPVALISLVDADRYYFTSVLGLPEPWVLRREAPLSHSLCRHVVAARAPLLIEDARTHPGLAEASAIASFDLVAYAGVPLIAADAQVLGTLCVIDTVPRAWASDDTDLLRDLAAVVMTEIERRNDSAERSQVARALSDSNSRLMTLTHQLSRSRDLLRTLFDGLDDGMALLDAYGTMLAVNQALAALVGARPQVISYRPWIELCGAGFGLPAQFVMHTLHDGRARRRRDEYRRADGQCRVLDMQALPLIGPTKEVEQVIVHIVDMTETLELEALVIQNERFAASGKLAAAIAHELNTPLQSVKSCLYLAGGAGGSQREDYLALAREELDRVSLIVRQMLDLHRPSSGELLPIDIRGLIERVLLLTGSTLAERGIETKCECAPALPPLLGRADQLTQVLLNLILNAADAMPDGGLLRIHLSLCDTRIAIGAEECTLDPSAGDQPCICIKISDSGAGISQADQERIFEPFFTTKSQGSGLGLAISQKIIAQHGGQISVQSAPGAGSSFTITLPLDDAQEENS